MIELSQAYIDLRFSLKSMPNIELLGPNQHHYGTYCKITTPTGIYPAEVSFNSNQWEQFQIIARVPDEDCVGHIWFSSENLEWLTKYRSYDGRIGYGGDVGRLALFMLRVPYSEQALQESIELMIRALDELIPILREDKREHEQVNLSTLNKLK